MKAGHNPNNLHAVPAETNLTLGRPTFYGHYEFVQKDEEERGIQLPDGLHAVQYPVFNINALPLGASFRLTSATTKAPKVHIGGQSTGYLADERLDSYDGQHPLSASVYVRLNAPWMRM